MTERFTDLRRLHDVEAHPAKFGRHIGAQQFGLAQGLNRFKRINSVAIDADRVRGKNRFADGVYPSQQLTHVQRRRRGDVQNHATHKR